MTDANGINNGEASGRDVLHLNVSGKLVAVLRSTLTCLEGSMLAARFSGRWDDGLEKDRDGNIFINQPPDLFVTMIDFLQRMGNSIPVSEATAFPTVKDFGGSDDRFEAFADMVEYYGMTALVLPPAIHLEGMADEEGRWVADQNLDDRDEISKYVRISGHHMETCKGSLFQLRTQTRRRIRSFEVTIGDIFSFCIGWGKEVEDALLFDPSCAELCYGPDPGCRIRTGLPVECGSVIRCELMGSDLVWSVKGESYRRPRDTQKYLVWTVNGKTYRQWRNDYFYLDVDPMVAGKGTWWVSKIEF
jgi:BTB/POZ domain